MRYVCRVPGCRNVASARGLCLTCRDKITKKYSNWEYVIQFRLPHRDEKSWTCQCEYPLFEKVFINSALQCRICSRPPLRSLSTNLMTPFQINYIKENQ